MHLNFLRIFKKKKNQIVLKSAMITRHENLLVWLQYPCPPPPQGFAQTY